MNPSDTDINEYLKSVLASGKFDLKHISGEGVLDGIGLVIAPTIISH